MTNNSKFIAGTMVSLYQEFGDNVARKDISTLPDIGCEEITFDNGEKYRIIVQKV